MVALRLAKQGYFCGSPVGVLDAPVDAVLAIMSYEAFEDDYQTAYMELNRQ